jgi:hypothetical protein
VSAPYLGFLRKACWKAGEDTARLIQLSRSIFRRMDHSGNIIGFDKPQSTLGNTFRSRFPVSNTDTVIADAEASLCDVCVANGYFISSRRNSIGLRSVD